VPTTDTDAGTLREDIGHRVSSCHDPAAIAAGHPQLKQISGDVTPPRGEVPRRVPSVD